MWVGCYECQQHLKIQPKTSVAHRTWLTPKSKMCIASLCNDIFSGHLRNICVMCIWYDYEWFMSDIFRSISVLCCNGQNAIKTKRQNLLFAICTRICETSEYHPSCVQTVSSLVLRISFHEFPDDVIYEFF